jgi:hypothetical protein
MSKKAIDMTGIIQEKGAGTPAQDSPERSVSLSINERTNKLIDENKTPSSEFVNLGFKVPREFRHRIRKIAADQDISLVEVLRTAIDLYEKKYIK